MAPTKIAPPAEKAGLIPYASEGGHWYDKTGEPQYEVLAKKKDPISGELIPYMRSTTLRDARKFGWVPSVTGVMRVAAAPGLEHWKREQLMMSSLTLPRIHGETLEELAARIAQDAEAQAIKARDIGTLIHNSIENCLCGQPYDPQHADHVDGALAALDEWCGLDGIQSERSFAHPLGFGGKVDIHKIDPEHVADFKTKDFGPSNLPKTYETHDMQLAAYRNGFDIVRARCAIIFVSTSVPGLTHLVEIDEKELARAWEMFQCLLQFWQIKNRYDSRIV